MLPPEVALDVANDDVDDVDIIGLKEDEEGHNGGGKLGLNRDVLGKLLCKRCVCVGDSMEQLEDGTSRLRTAADAAIAAAAAAAIVAAEEENGLFEDAAKAELDEIKEEELLEEEEEEEEELDITLLSVGSKFSMNRGG